MQRPSLACASPLLALLAILWGVVTMPLRADELILASPHWEGAQFEFDRAFRNHYQVKTGRPIEMRWRDLGGTSQIEKAIDAAFKVNSNSCGIDIFFGGGMDPYENQKSKGHLLPHRLPDPLLAALPPAVLGVELVDPDFTFYGAALSSFGLVENRPLIRTLNLPPVKTWSDLCQPELFGWVSSADPRKSGSVHMIYEIILQAYGWDRGWAVIYQSSGNARSFLPSSSAPTKEVSIGDAAYAISIDINGLCQQSFLGIESVRFLLPEGATVITPDGIAILKGAPNLEAARLFMDFVLSDAGQSLWMKPRGHPAGPTKFDIARMGVLPALYSAPESRDIVPINPFTLEKASFVYNAKIGSARWKVLNDLMGQTVIDVHSHLRTAWRAILAAPAAERPALIAELSRPPVSEEEAAKLIAIWKGQPLQAAELRNAWMIDAVTRFQSLARRAQTQATR